MSNKSAKWLISILLISLLTNVVLVIRLQYPAAWHHWRLAMIPPPQLTATDHIRGPLNASVTVIVYTNYQCPYCTKLNDNLLALMSELDFRWSYRHSADPTNQPLAFKAAQAAECAGEQGKFWEYSDQLFTPAQQLDEDVLQQIAQQLKLDLTGFIQCIDTEKYKNWLIAAKQQAEEKQIGATPTYFINGKRHIGLKPYAELEQLIAAAKTNS